MPGIKNVYRIWVASKPHPIADVLALESEVLKENVELEAVDFLTNKRFSIKPSKIEKILIETYTN